MGTGDAEPAERTGARLGDDDAPAGEHHAPADRHLGGADERTRRRAVAGRCGRRLRGRGRRRGWLGATGAGGARGAAPPWSTHRWRSTHLSHSSHRSSRSRSADPRGTVTLSSPVWSRPSRWSDRRSGCPRGRSPPAPPEPRGPQCRRPPPTGRRRLRRERLVASSPTRAAPSGPPSPFLTPGRNRSQRPVGNSGNSEGPHHTDAGLRGGSPGWTRTNNPPINSRMLCQLSYRGSRPQRLARGFGTARIGSRLTPQRRPAPGPGRRRRPRPPRATPGRSRRRTRTSRRSGRPPGSAVRSP